MEFIRKIINSDELSDIVSLPNELKHQNVELIILPILKKQSDKQSFNPQDYEGLLNIDFNSLTDQINQLRTEWDRF